MAGRPPAGFAEDSRPWQMTGPVLGRATAGGACGRGAGAFGGEGASQGGPLGMVRGG